MNDPIVTGVVPNPGGIRRTAHVLLQWPVGSRPIKKQRQEEEDESEEESNRNERRKQGECRHCPAHTPEGKRNRSRRSSWYCGACNVALHPQCFHEFHLGKSEEFRPTNPIKFVPNYDEAV